MFSYNRANFMFDSGQRWARYMAGYTFAIDQVAMYREDIDQMCDITVSKMDNIHGVSGLMMVIMIQLIMAGRLGVHGPAPPGWLMGMYWTNCGLMIMWLMLACWFAIHGGARAQAGGAYLKTRSVRLPIPTPKQLDKARVFGNHWERQRVWDTFRIPFVAPAPKDNPVDLKGEQIDDSDSDGSSKGGSMGSPPGKNKKKTAGPVSDYRSPAWANEEISQLHGGSGGAPVTSTTTPEHFELFRGLQHEWWQHECYARIAIFFAFTHWLSAASLYIMCHCFIELRANWPAYSCVIILVAAHWCINALDICRMPRKNSFFNVPMEFIVPFPPLLVSVCLGIDYSILEEWRFGWVNFVFCCSFLCYFTYFLWAIRMYDICRPDVAVEEKKGMPEEAGKPWWPGEWSLPVSFQHTLYLVAPPKYLEPGESCLWQEMKAGRGNQANVPPVKQREIKHSDAAWKVCRGANLVSIIMWGFIICGRVHALVWTQWDYGDMRYMLKQEGRTLRWPSHMQPWMSPWTRQGDRGEWCHTGGCDRRLGEAQWMSRHRMADTAENLMPILKTISEKLQQEESPTISLQPEKVDVPMIHASVDWPVDFRPELLTCSHTGPVAALARDQRSGAVVHLTGAVQARNLQSFTFAGVDHLGEVLGSHWGKDGMLLTMKNGHLAECTGMPVDSFWQCKETGSRLPLGGSSLRKAVVARDPNTKDLFRAAVVYHGEPSVTIFETDGDSGIWFPTGEAHLPSFMEQAPSFSMSMGADELVLMTEGGGVLKWAITDAEPTILAPPPRDVAVSSMAWQTACRLSDNRIARLGHRRTEGGVVPEIFVSNGL